MKTKLAVAAALAFALGLAAASAQPGDQRVPVAQGGPLIPSPPQRQPAQSACAELVTRVGVLEAQVAQLADRVTALNSQVEGYSTHRHGFNDNIASGEAAHDITGQPQP